jgi:hypothetical protein
MHGMCRDGAGTFHKASPSLSHKRLATSAKILAKRDNLILRWRPLSHTAPYRSMRATVLPGPKVAVAACKDKRSSRHVYRIARKLELDRGPELVLLRTTAVYLLLFKEQLLPSL